MNKINSQDIAYDPFGLYLIIVSPEIQYTGVAEARDAFCTKSCGMHDFLTASTCHISVKKHAIMGTTKVL